MSIRQWKFKKLSATQILREINLWGFLVDLDPLDLNFGEILPSPMARIPQNLYSKNFKMAVFGICKTRKIQVEEKFLNFHTASCTMCKFDHFSSN